MFKNKAALSITAIAIVALMIVGATLAWFTANDSVTNVVTLGNIDITLTETDPDTEEPTEDGLEFEDVVPGATLPKDPTVTNTGANDAYVRAKVEYVVKNAAGAVITPTSEQAAFLGNLLSNLKGTIDTDVWGLVAAGGVDWFYYDGVLKPNDFAVLFTQVVIPDNWDNDMANLKFELVVSVEAVQADNFLSGDFSVAALAAAWEAEAL